MTTRQRRKQRTVRIEDEIWQLAQSAAETNDETLSDVVRRALADYIKRNDL